MNHRIVPGGELLRPTSQKSTPRRLCRVQSQQLHSTFDPGTAESPSVASQLARPDASEPGLRRTKSAASLSSHSTTKSGTPSAWASTPRPSPQSDKALAATNTSDKKEAARSSSRSESSLGARRPCVGVPATAFSPAPRRPPSAPPPAAARCRMSASLSGASTAESDEEASRLERWELWKEEHRCPLDARIFVAVRCPFVRDAMIARGWFRNPDPRSEVFDLKWNYLPLRIFPSHTVPHQIVNRIDNSREAFALKTSLTRSLKECWRRFGVASESFYPRAFDMTCPVDRMRFLEDYRRSRAEALLQAFVQHAGTCPRDPTGPLTCFRREVVEAALFLCGNSSETTIQWMSRGLAGNGGGKHFEACWTLIRSASLSSSSAPISSSTSEKKFEEFVANSFDRCAAQAASWQRNRRLTGQHAEHLKGRFGSVAATGSLVERARKALAVRGSQCSLNATHNAWIVKPGDALRGQGIHVLRDLDAIASTIVTQDFNWVCQKYVERPQLVAGFKFDIRQWVLVTEVTPLKAYVYKDCHFRFAASKYDQNMKDLRKSVHLTNGNLHSSRDDFCKIHPELGTSCYSWARRHYQKWLHDIFCKRERHSTPWMEENIQREGDELTREHTTQLIGDDVASGRVVGASILPDDLCLGSITKTEQHLEETIQGQLQVAEAATPVEVLVTPLAFAAPLQSNRLRRTAEATPVPAAAAEASAAAAVAVSGAAVALPGRGSLTATTADEKACEDLWEASIRPQIRRIVGWVLGCAAQKLSRAPNAHHLYGFDLMIGMKGDRPKVWLLEVNAQPSTGTTDNPIKTDLVKRMLEDLLKVVIDLPEDASAPIGDWELLSPPRCMSQKAARDVATKMPVTSERHSSSGGCKTSPRC